MNSILRAVTHTLLLILWLVATIPVSAVNTDYPANTGLVNIASYGALPDDGIDDTNAIQRAISDYLDTTSTIYLPAGTYHVSRSMDWWTSRWLRFDLGSAQSIDRVALAWDAGATTKYYFNIDLSDDNTTWRTVYSGSSSGNTTALEPHTFTATTARYVRIVGLGSSVDNKMYVTDAAVGNGTTTLAISAATGSEDTASLLNAYDGNLATVWKCDGQSGPRLGIEGQNRDTTIIKLANNAPGFNDPAKPRYVIRTNNRPGVPNNAFYNYLFNFTVDTGTGNTGAIGIDYAVCNIGSMRDITVRSGDGQGVTGISLGGWPGPGLLKNITVDGFNTGIKNRSAMHSMTMENITLKNQKVLGLDGASNGNFIHNLVSINPSSTQVIDLQGGIMTLIGADFTFTGGTGTTAKGAIVYSDPTTGNIALYARDVVVRATPADAATPPTIVSRTVTGSTTSYSTVLSGNVTEHANNPKSLFDAPLTALKLPIEDFTPFHDNNMANWVSVTDHGATPGDANDDTAGIQAAIDYAAANGKSTVYFPKTRGNWATYFVSDTIRIHGGIQRLMGFGSFIMPTGKSFDVPSSPKAAFVAENLTSDQLLVDRLVLRCRDAWQPPRGLITFQNNSSKTVAFRDGYIETYQHGPNPGKLFSENIGCGEWKFVGQKAWIRQLNPETPFDPKLINDGGDLWILGVKTEESNTAILTKGGGRTEVLGAYIFSNYAQFVKPIFESIDSQASYAFMSHSWAPSIDYASYVRETRNGETRQLFLWDTTCNGNSLISCHTTGAIDNHTPNVAITSPADGTVVNAGASVNVTASVSDSDGTVASVSLHRIDAIKTVSTIPTLIANAASGTMDSLPPGHYRVYAKATDNLGRTAVSEPVTVIVKTNGATGTILREYFDNIPISPYLGSLTGAPNFPHAPALWDYSTDFSSARTVADEHWQLGRRYGTCMRGWVTPPETGSYTFAISADQTGALFLSTDSDPNNKRLIARTQGETTKNVFDKQPEQRSAAITLTAGERYYIEMIHKKDWGNFDHVEVAWSTPSNSVLTVIPGRVLSPWDNQNSASIPVPGQVTLHPQDDAQIRGIGYPGQYFGSVNTFTVDYFDRTRGLDALIKFNLDNLPGNVTAATLKLTPKSVAAGGFQHRIGTFPDDSWTERTVAWETAPAVSTVTDFATFTPVTGIPVSLDVKSQVLAEVAGNKIISFRISSAGPAGATVYYSSEDLKDLSPQLIIQTDAADKSVAAPTFSRVVGSYSNPQSVTINTTTSGASIRYTTDGSTPTPTTGTVYSAPVSIAGSSTLKAIAYKSGMPDSAVTSGPYTINGIPAPLLNLDASQTAQLTKDSDGNVTAWAANGHTLSTTQAKSYETSWSTGTFKSPVWSATALGGDKPGLTFDTKNGSTDADKTLLGTAYTDTAGHFAPGVKTTILVCTVDQSGAAPFDSIHTGKYGGSDSTVRSLRLDKSTPFTDALSNDWSGNNWVNGTQTLSLGSGKMVIITTEATARNYINTQLGNDSYAGGSTRAFGGVISQLVLLKDQLSADARAGAAHIMATKWGISGVPAATQAQIDAALAAGVPPM